MTTILSFSHKFYLREFAPLQRERLRVGGRIRARPRDVVYFIWNNCLCRSSNHGILVIQNCPRFLTTQYTVCGRWARFCTLNSIRMNMNSNSEYISSEPFYSTLPLLPAHYLPFWDSLTRKPTQYWSHIHSYYTYCPFFILITLLKLDSELRLAQNARSL